MNLTDSKSASSAATSLAAATGPFSAERPAASDALEAERVAGHGLPSIPSSAAATEPGPTTDSEDRGSRKKEKSEFGRAEPWQRYRALVDTVKEAQDLVDLADHKARFALIIMGALNAAILILGTRSEFIARLPPEAQPWLYLYFALYAITAVYFFVQAIESLRPRAETLVQRAELATFAQGEDGMEASNLGLRFFADAVRYDLPTYLAAWRNIRVSQLNTELATQAYTLARINRAKYAAIAKLYSGLQALTLLTWGFVVGMAVLAWVDHEVRALSRRSSAEVPVVMCKAVIDPSASAIAPRLSVAPRPHSRFV